MGIRGRGEETPPPDNRKTTSWGIMPLCTAAKKWIFACKIAKNVDFHLRRPEEIFSLRPLPSLRVVKNHSSTWPEAASPPPLTSNPTTTKPQVKGHESTMPINLRLPMPGKKKKRERRNRTYCAWDLMFATKLLAPVHRLYVLIHGNL